MESLLNHGANVDTRYPEHALVFGLPEPQTVALHNAAERVHEVVVRLLLEHDADIEAKIPLIPQHCTTQLTMGTPKH